jgi:membrane protease YdiL (CAAX protease family)
LNDSLPTRNPDEQGPPEAVPEIPSGADSATPPEAVPAAPVLEPRRDPPWGVYGVLGLILFFLIALGITSAFGFAIYAFRHGIRDATTLEKAVAHNAFLLIPIQIIVYALCLGFLYFNVRIYHGAEFWKAIRWNSLPARLARRYLAVGVVSAVVIQFASAVAAPKKKLPIDQLLSSPGAIYILAAFGILVAPFVEEMVFRGYLYPVLARALGTNLGILWTAVLFAAIHVQQLWGGWAQMALLLLVGWILTYVRAQTGSVVASYLVHLSYNSTVFLVLWLATDFFRKLPMK